MGYFQVRYDSRVVIYERKMFIRLATDVALMSSVLRPFGFCGTLNVDPQIVAIKMKMT